MLGSEVFTNTPSWNLCWCVRTRLHTCVPMHVEVRSQCCMSSRSLSTLIFWGRLRSFTHRSSRTGWPVSSRDMLVCVPSPAVTDTPARPRVLCGCWGSVRRPHAVYLALSLAEIFLSLWKVSTWFCSCCCEVSPYCVALGGLELAM